MEINIIKAIQSIANSFLDVVMWLITKMGEEIFFLLIFAGIYLLYSKKFAFKYTFYYLISVGVNAVIKMIVRRPRPYVTSSEVINRLPASEYSFPSGHSQGYFVQATTATQQLYKTEAKKGVKISFLCIAIFMGLAVMFSRMYWGQHYLSDTIVGALVGLAVPFIIDYALYLCPKKWKDKFTLDLICKILVVACICGFGVMLVADIAWGIASRKVYTFLGVYTAMSLGYLLDNKYIHYEEKSSCKIFWLKLIITYAVVVGLYFLLDLILPISGFVYYLVYLFLGLVVSIGLPLLFKTIFKNNTNIDSEINANTDSKGNANSDDEAKESTK